MEILILSLYIGIIPIILFLCKKIGIEDCFLEVKDIFSNNYK